MDLKNYDLAQKSEEGAELTLAHPSTYEPLDVTITLVGTDSKRYRNKIHELSQRNMNARKGKRNQPVDMDKSEREACEILAACTLDWSGIEENGQTVECTESEAQRIYMSYRWIREQVDSFVADRANFFPA